MFPPTKKPRRESILCETFIFNELTLLLFSPITCKHFSALQPGLAETRISTFRLSFSAFAKWYVPLQPCIAFSGPAIKK